MYQNEEAHVRVVTPITDGTDTCSMENLLHALRIDLILSRSHARSSSDSVNARFATPANRVCPTEETIYRSPSFLILSVFQYDFM